MHPSLQNMTAMMLLIALLSFSVTEIDSYIQTQENHKAKEVIIKTIASECQEMKAHYKLEDTFENTSKVLTQMLGSGLTNLDEETYLAVVSFCYTSKPKTPKEKI